MTLTQWFIFFLVIQVIHFLGTWKLYIRAGRTAWEAAVPIYNAVVLMQIINRPRWWTFLLFIPIVNLIMFPVIWVETIRSFGKNSLLDTVLVIVTLGFYIYYINYTEQGSYIPDRSLIPKSGSGEWISSVLFAVVAATIVHTYFMQPFTIPTASLEKTLLVGDFLFVSKFYYGARTPMTTVSFPMVHDTIPIVGTKSYTKWPQLPYFRIPGFEEIERSDIVVFNWPVDTVNRFYGLDDGRYYDKPIDKKSNYVKRCVGLPGDSIKIVDGKVFANGNVLNLPDRAKPQYSYTGTATGGFNAQNLYESYNITDGMRFTSNKDFIVFSLTEESAANFENHPNVTSLKRNIMDAERIDPTIFPKGEASLGNRDQMRSLFIPKKGATTPINQKTLPLYKRLIEVYEGEEMGIKNKLSQNGTEILLNGQPITEYTFKQDYYWMMGDNRHNSEDSRFWGYVPASHVVGKPVLIFLSYDGNATGLDKIRWERLFTTVGGSGEPVSYFWYIVIAGIGFYVVRKIIKIKKTR